MRSIDDGMELFSDVALPYFLDLLSSCTAARPASSFFLKCLKWNVISDFIVGDGHSMGSMLDDLTITVRVKTGIGSTEIVSSIRI